MSPKPRNRDRLWVYLLSIGLFVGIALLALLVTRGYAVDWDSFAIQKRGVIVLKSDPDAAVITLDGKRLDKRTNARLSLAANTYQVTVQAPGRIPWQREIGLDPGEAVIEEIVLFPESPPRTAVTKRPVERFAISPDGHRAAAVVRESKAPRRQLQMLDIGGSGSGSERFGIRLNAVPSRIAVNDEGFVLAENAGRIAVYAPSGKRVARISGGAGGLVGDKLVFQRKSRVIETDRSGGNARTLASSPRRWTSTDRRTYVLDRSGKVIGIAPGAKGVPVGGTDAIAAITAIGPDVVQTAGRDGSFGIIRGDTFKSIAAEGGSGVRATLSPDGAFVAYRTSRELRLFEWRTGADRLITSLTTPPDRIVALPGGRYVLYRRGVELHAMARDGSNDRTVTSRIGSEPAMFALDRIFAKDSRTGRLVRIDLAK
ncbi:MAG: PEGA domain-containing protein [bacterium]|nr:PEGA domain-containing protein [bacterium]MDZ4248370.1 PEGA domain-containing protein [Patescibacteria group bacterium]